MTKQFAAFHVSWRHARRKQVGLFANEASYGKAAAEAVETKLNELAEEGWIVDRVIPSYGLTPQQSASFTIVAFK